MTRTRKLMIAASLATVGALAVAGTVMAADRDWPHQGMGMGRGRGDRPFLGGILLLIAVAAVVGLGVWLLMRRRPAVTMAGAGAGGFGVAAPTTSPTAPISPIAGAETILAERLARSEITPDEYRSTLAALRESAPGAVPAAPVAPWSPVPPVAQAPDAGDASTSDGAGS